MQPVQFNAEHTIKSGDNYRCCIRIIGEDRKMKYYKLSMDMNGENDIICHFDDKFTIPQNALITLINGMIKRLFVFQSEKEVFGPIIWQMKKDGFWCPRN